MDFSESTKVVYSRIQKLDPENVGKIIGILLLQEHGERNMIRLAFSPDNLIQSVINKAKTELCKHVVSSPISPSQVNQVAVSDLPMQFTPYSPSLTRPISCPTTLGAANPFSREAQVAGDQQPLQAVDFIPPGYLDSAAEDYCLQSHQMQFLPDFSSNICYHEPALGVRTRRSPSLPEFPLKVCHYFSKGFCKHGNNCRYFHGHAMPESFSQFFCPNSNEAQGDDHVVSPGSLEKLEYEIIELLKSRRGFPISIASLPMMYYEKYGRTLQAEGYLTESQRHGKAGYSLTKLLARLKNSIRLIDRPHGQHSVILAEDIPKYLEYTGEKTEPGGIIAGSRQIYLTFPAESNFTEQDVSNYFNKYGPVQDVRIPCQQKRMFGFVTFLYADTVRHILSKGNPHFVCGARVLVKPYREKSRPVDRKFSDKMQHSPCFNSHYIDADADLHSMPRICDSSRLLRKQFIEEHQQVLECERRRRSEMHLAAKPLSHHHHLYYGYSMDDFKHPEANADQAEFPYAKEFNILLDAWNNASISEDKIRHINTNYTDHQDSSQGIILPESPFASAVSTVT
ncbi:PREDICTED: zinc finger CCCH domain-containing protein 18 isoform X1 [Fragaria vesca subsp. vesca]|uniref:zinc finger CCCH domain-containing protein 18 isoform X1 n=1 Tax=Fragaria vesca subsp. vesca TaxID=101020 RepID=UPI0002C31928|nr:PREDICTED: zinc finger CCCH domain-containing protein 18 isoform X1 [Fragaria vesca subsp. vesca]